MAITRAKRRVVILIKKDTKTMRDFFVKLEGCSIIQSDAKTAFLEFDSRTSPEEWFDRGMGLFEVSNNGNVPCLFSLCHNLYDFFLVSYRMMTSKQLQTVSKQLAISLIFIGPRGNSRLLMDLFMTGKSHYENLLVHFLRREIMNIL